MSYEKYYPGGWQSGESGGTPITPEALNHMENGIKQAYSDFAPAGYGLGSELGKACSDCDLALENGYYQIGASTAHRPDGMSTRCWKQVISYGSTYKTQICYSSSNAMQIRDMNNGTWSEWAWENPPMFLGVEYRTTERWNGATKYTKHIYIGRLADTGNKVVSLGIPYNKIVTIDIYGSDTGGKIRQKFPLTKNGAIVADAFVNSLGELVIGSYANNMYWEAYAVITYEK